MLSYIIRRLLILPFLLLAITLLIFMMLSLLTPYERASLYVSDIPKRQGALDGIIEKYGLNDPHPCAVLALAGGTHRPVNRGS